MTYSSLRWLLFVVFVSACGSEPDTSSLNQCNRESDCPPGETCCNGLCIAVGSVCGSDTTQPDTAQPDTDTVQPDTDTAQPDTDTSCTPDCGDKQCGDNGCGGTCGACDDGWTCVLGTCEQNGPPPAVWGVGVWGQSRWGP